MKNRLVLRINETELTKNFNSYIAVENYVNNKCEELNAGIYDWSIKETIEKNKNGNMQLLKLHIVVLK